MSTRLEAAKQRAKEYFENGYSVIPGVLSVSDIDQVYEQIDTLLSTTIAGSSNQTESLTGVDAKYQYLKETMPPMKSRAYDLMKFLDSVQAVTTNTEILSVAHEIVGSPVLVNNTLVRPDDFTNDRVRPFHQEGMGQISHDSVNVWIPLIDVNASTGSMRYVPGSHKDGYVPHRFYEEFSGYHGVHEDYLEGLSEEIATINKGDAFIFHPCLFHGSAPMLEEGRMRWTIITRLSGITRVPYLQDENAPLYTEQVEEKVPEQ